MDITTLGGEAISALSNPAIVTYGAIGVETALRLFKTDKPASMILAVAKLCHRGADLLAIAVQVANQMGLVLAKLSDDMNALVPQRVKDAAPANG